MSSSTTTTMVMTRKQSLSTTIVAPKLDINDLRKAIPKHCFESSLPRSLSYAVRDVTAITSLAWAANHISSIPYLGVRIVAWTTYGYLQGLLFTGLWILAHVSLGIIHQYARIC